MTLRIDISDERDRVVFTLTGRIQAEQLSELQALVKSDSPDDLALDLKEVKLVDRDAVRFLAEIEAQGARLRTAPRSGQWISRERTGMCSSGKQTQATLARKGISMWIVQLALRRPYTFVVMSILILVMGGVAIFRTPTDIFEH